MHNSFDCTHLWDRNYWSSQEEKKDGRRSRREEQWDVKNERGGDKIKVSGVRGDRREFVGGERVGWKSESSGVVGPPVISIATGFASPLLPSDPRVPRVLPVPLPPRTRVIKSELDVTQALQPLFLDRSFLWSEDPTPHISRKGQAEGRPLRRRNWNSSSAPAARGPPDASFLGRAPRPGGRRRRPGGGGARGGRVRRTRGGE